MKTGIYCITNSVNSKVYIGSARDLISRKSAHFTTLAKQTHKNPYLQRAYNKYGKESFIFSIVELCEKGISETDLLRLEAIYIAQYNCIAPSGYNLLTAERRILTTRHREILLDANKKSNLACYKKVHQYQLSGEFVAEHASISLAAKSLFPHLTITEIAKQGKGRGIGTVCRFERKSAFGYIWRFKRETVDPYQSNLRRKTKCLNVETGAIKYFGSTTDTANALGVCSSWVHDAAKRNFIIASKYKVTLL